ncbi:MAG TPA: hypothetical protein VFR90_01720 [Methylibium sp.]|uniref:hypothetical protein n=1 Tax=Methylibium sp. TaxID=2067992 RepID=UPI002DBB50B9|nr:hypothetical protein [Methylibium sp.]HEU4457822.1 hypothetical protein [Methylibium sp.]
MALQSEIYDPAVIATTSTTTDRGLRVAWGGVWSGFLVAIGVVLLLSTLGLAVGITTAEVGPGEDNGRSLGMGAAIWSGLTLLIALFIGGMVATRAGAIHDRATGLVEGALVWVLAVLALIYLAGTGLSMATGASFGALRGVTQTAASAAGSTDLSSIASGDPQQIVQRLDNPKTVQLVAAVTGKSQAEASSMVGEIRQQVEAAGDDPQRAAQAAREGVDRLSSAAAERVGRAAERAQPYASATMWSTLAAMVVALLASIFGAMLGRRQVLRRLESVAVAPAGGVPVRR